MRARAGRAGGAPSRGRRAELLLALGDARLRAGEPRARGVRRRRRARPRAPARAERARPRRARVQRARRDDHRRRRQPPWRCSRRRSRALPDDHPLRARLVARLAIETYYASTPAQRKALGDEAVALARAGDATALLDALNARHAALWSAAYLDERLATADEMIALARELGDAERELQGRNWRVLDLLERGDLAAARDEIERHEALAERLRLPAYQWWGPMWRSSLAILEGRLADAERLIEEIAAVDDENARLYARDPALRPGLGARALRPGRRGADRPRVRPARRVRLPRGWYAWILGHGRPARTRRARQIEWVTRRRLRPPRATT